MYRWTPSTRKTLLPASCCRWAAVVFFAAALGGSLTAALRAQDSLANEEETLATYLDELGLTDLQIVHSEQLLNSMAAGPARVSRARQLADLYAGQLTTYLDNAPRYTEISNRIDVLLRRIPEARTPSLDVMLLQADYQRAESLLSKWFNDPSQSALRSEALSILDRIAPILDQHQAELKQQIERRLSALEQIPVGQGDALEREVQRLQTVVARAAYFSGWTLYYRGVLSAAARREDVVRARAIFRQLLDLDDEPYTALQPELLGLESPWRSRSLIGLGMCEAATGDVAASYGCFQLLSSNTVPSVLRDQADYWYVQGLLLAGQRAAATTFAAQRVPALSGEATAGKVSFCVALIRGGYSGATAETTQPPAPELADWGIRGLAKLRQYRVLREMLERYGIQIDRPEGFLLRWLAAQQRRDMAETSRKADDYRSAAAAFSEALAAGDAQSDLAAASHCRSELAWCFYQLEQWTEAARTYQIAAEGLKAAKDAAALDTGWMAFVAAHRSAQQAPRSSALMDEMANWLQREFPGQDPSRRAAFLALKSRMQGSSVPDQLRALQAISADDPNYLSARQEICSLQYQMWRESDADGKSAAADVVLQSVDALLQSPAAERLANPEQIELRLMATDVALGGEIPDQARAVAHLAAVAPRLLRDGEPVDSTLIAEFHYRRLQLARLQNEAAVIREEADWFVAHGQGSRFEAAGLVAAARALDEQVDVPSAADRDKALRVYRRLSALLGDTPQVLSANRNAQIALLKFADYALAAGHIDDSIAALDRLLAAFPKDRGYLRRAGRARMAARQFAPALDHWRTILAGSRVGSDEWYEAKHAQIECLMATDRDAAAAVFRQFELLDPELGGDAWREKFSNVLKN
jgi:tetratricopeptide (TPR) repeat protein